MTGMGGERRDIEAGGRACPLILFERPACRAAGPEFDPLPERRQTRPAPITKLPIGRARRRRWRGAREIGRSARLRPHSYLLLDWLIIAGALVLLAGIVLVWLDILWNGLRFALRLAGGDLS